MKYVATCSECNRETDNLFAHECFCGGSLKDNITTDFRVEAVDVSNYTVWRYAASLPPIRREDIVTLGEGWTPLVKLTDKVFLKLENLNPTGSFKDRGSTVLLSAIRKLVKSSDGYISEDSSGNAGASIAAYASHAGLRAKIYVPRNVSGPKLSQIQFYGAEVVKIEGDRNKVSSEAAKDEIGKFYVGHVSHPLFRAGIRSIAYEIAEQLHWQAPDRIYLPVSAGTLLLGVISGFQHLAKSKTIESMPEVVACQTEQVSPLYHCLKDLSYDPPERIKTIADALISTNPPLLNLMVKRLKKIRGRAIIVGEDEILPAFHELCLRGFLVEPSSAVAYAAYKKQLASGTLENGLTVIILTGTGLKTTLKPD